MKKFPNAKILSGGTDLSLEVTKLRKELKTIISLNSIEKLNYASEYLKSFNNIDIILMDDYNQRWDINENVDVVFIDCVHEELYVTKDIETAIEYGTSDVLIIFDDYGHPDAGVKSAVDKAIDNGTLKLVKYIGEEKGNEPKKGSPLIDWEGIICQKS